MAIPAITCARSGYCHRARLGECVELRLTLFYFLSISLIRLNWSKTIYGKVIRSV